MTQTITVCRWKTMKGCRVITHTWIQYPTSTIYLYKYLSMKGIGLSHTRIQSSAVHGTFAETEERSVPTIFQHSTIVVIFIFRSFFIISHGPSQGYPVCGHIICFFVLSQCQNSLLLPHSFIFHFLLDECAPLLPAYPRLFFPFFFPFLGECCAVRTRPQIKDDLNIG